MIAHRIEKILSQVAYRENLIGDFSYVTHRRHLTSGQRAMVAVDILPMLEEEARERQKAAGAAGVAFGILGGRGNKKPLDQKIDQGVSDEDVCEKRNPQSAKQAAGILSGCH